MNIIHDLNRPLTHPANRAKFVSLFLILALSGYFSSADAKYASIVIDAETGRVLHEANADNLHYPASLTKMMTLYMVFSALQNKKITLDTRWTVSSFAARQPPTKLGLRAGRTIKVKDCILALVTKSANDMAVVAAEGLAGSEFRFAQSMTEKSRDLKMKQTTFKNASGLPDVEQTTTARDIAILAVALMRDFPEYYRFFSTRGFQYGKRYYRNHNRLLDSYQGTDGIKTGYIRASGYNLAASTVRNGRRLIGVVMGGRTANARNRQMVNLLDRAFLELERGKTRQAAYLSDNRLVVVTPPTKRQYASPERTERITVTEIPSHRKTAEPKWGIQVGAFSYFKPAQSAASQAKISAPELLRTTQTVISPFRKQSGFIYRARLIGLAERQARKACEILRSKEISCITVPPSNEQAVFTVR